MSATLGDPERHRQRAGAQHEREILRGGEILAAHRDLAARADRAVDDRRTTHDAAVEHDRHVVAARASPSRSEAAAALVAQLNSTMVPSVGLCVRAARPSDTRR